jgi:hypothetical protein
MNSASAPTQFRKPACPLVSYIAPGAPATRREATGNEPFLRPEIGFTPAWYRQHADIDFGERFHTDPAYRRDCSVTMRRVLRQRFPGTRIGGGNLNEGPLDLLTGTYGAGTVAAIYGVPPVYYPDNWPNCAHHYLTDTELARLEPPDLDDNPHFNALLEQIAWIEGHEGVVTGFINWQGVLNNAHRLRGGQLFLDMMDEPEKARHLFACVARTMADGIRRLHERQRVGGVDHRFVTVSNCLVNLVSPAVYQDLLLPFDRQLAAIYGRIGVHNCAWNATPYLNVGLLAAPWVRASCRRHCAGSSRFSQAANAGWSSVNLAGCSASRSVCTPMAAMAEVHWPSPGSSTTRMRVFRTPLKWRASLLRPLLLAWGAGLGEDGRGRHSITVKAASDGSCSLT